MNHLKAVAAEKENPKIALLIAELGIHKAIANKPAKDDILARLKQGAVPWWDSDLIWTAHKEILKEFIPQQSWYQPSAWDDDGGGLV
jgi:hypothetical protein